MRALLLLFACLTVVHGCGRGEWRKPRLPAISVATPRPAGESALCPGGLLCESKSLLLGWRVPVGCRPSVGGHYLAACFLADAPWPKVVEFFQTRYASTLLVPGGLQVTQALKPLALRVNAVPAPTKGARPPKVPELLEPTLSVRRRPMGIELVAVAGEDAAPARR